LKRWKYGLLAGLVLHAAPAPGAEVEPEPEPPSMDAATPAPPAPWVEIRVLGDERALALVRATATELFSRLEVRLRVLGADEASPADDVPLVLAYVDLRVPTSPLVDVDDGRTRQELMRRALPDVSSLETGVEAALHVVLSSVESMLQLAEPVPPPPVASPPPPAPAPKSDPRGPGVDVGALFRLVSFGASRLTPGAGAALEFRTDLGSVQPELGIWGAIHTTTALDFSDGHASVRPYALRVMPGLSARMSRSLLGSVAFGVGLDHFVLEAGAPPSGGQIRDRVVSDPVLSAQLGLRFPLVGAWFMSAQGTLDVDLAPTRFMAERELAREALFALPRWRGGFTLVASLSPTAIQRFPRSGEQP
jgi:hypothetical protein